MPDRGPHLDWQHTYPTERGPDFSWRDPNNRQRYCRVHQTQNVVDGRAWAWAAADQVNLGTGFERTKEGACLRAEAALWGLRGGDGVLTGQAEWEWYWKAGALERRKPGVTHPRKR